MRRRRQKRAIAAQVSIHASVKDATDGEGINVDFTHVSIHASVKDATIVMRDNRIEKIVSIHASVKDATTLHQQVASLYFGFNPRICKRCDILFVCRPARKQSFNPRICKRCDLSFYKVPLRTLWFQSTHL